ncbi:unnamed protein product [Phytomonas sp. Hart1]|nr:unnamed protein product [Phytomonas sp. Hart1]|eukprot:CCW66981.1 unnamed protein product [Phytomonas sp. isolate Hart1]
MVTSADNAKTRDLLLKGSTQDNLVIILPEKELCDIRVCATRPTLYYAIPIDEDVLVTIDFQEFSFTSQCELLLSFVDPHPSRNTASWKLLSPESKKRMVIHPTDYSYISKASVGDHAVLNSQQDTSPGHKPIRCLYLCVSYLNGCGSSFFRLVVHLREEYYSTWYSQSKRTPPMHATLQDHNVPAQGLASQMSFARARMDENSQADRNERAEVIKGEKRDFSDSVHRLKNATATTTITPIEDGFRTMDSTHKSEKSFDYHNTIDNVGTYTQGGMHLMYSTFYAGAWKGLYPHGRGIAYYKLLNGECRSKLSSPFTSLNHTLLQMVQKQHNLPWSAMTLSQDPTLGGIDMDDTFLSSLTNIQSIEAVVAAARSINLTSTFFKTNESTPKEVPTANTEAATVFWDLITLDPERRMEAYHGEWQLGRKHGLGVYQWSDRIYIGEWVKGLRDGYGVLLRQDGSWYRGEWSNDRRHGHGESLLLQSDSPLLYRGQWVKGLREGDGSLIYPSGVVVDGTWEADVIDTNVHARYPDGTVFKGGWQDGLRHGTGIFTNELGNVYTNTWEMDRPIGAGTVQLANGVRFEGQWLDDGHVDGEFHFPKGTVYTGEWNWILGGREGRGRCVFHNGDVYEGEWRNDQQHGKGRMHYHATGAVYDGSWKSGVRCGMGILTEGDDVYEGEFEQDERSGSGTQKSKDGSTYTGDWRFNHRAGYGVFYDAKERATYIGVFLYNRLQAYATAVFEKYGKEKYEGSWLDGKQQGKGTFTFDNGDVLCGVWHLGKPQDGIVKYTCSDGTRYVGDWVGGSRCGYGTEVRKDGSVYEGEWAQNKPFGRGRLINPDGKVLESSWEDGKIASGCCKIAYPCGSVYCGDQINGIPHGEGTLSYPDGTVFKGTFREGIYSL